MKIIKYPSRIRGEDYTAEVRFCQCEYDLVMVQTDLYRGLRRMGQKPEFTFRKRVPIETYIREAEGEMRSMEEKIRKYMKNEDLEPKKTMQKIILDTIVAYIQKFGYPPTVREIGEIVGLKSSSSVYRHLKALEEQGFIINDGMPRAISVVGWKFVKEGKKNATIKSNH